MPQSMGDVLLGFAAAVQGSHALLSYLLKMSAMEAYERAAVVNQPRDHVPVVGLWDWDVPNNIRHLDPVGASLLGYEAKDHDFLSQDQLTRCIHPDDIEGWQKKVKSVTESGGIYENKYRIIRDGKTRWLYAKGKCTLDKSGKPECFPGALIDVTDQETNASNTAAVKAGFASQHTG